MESNSDSKQLWTKKRHLLIIRCRSSTKRHLRMKKRVPITVENKKTVERKNNFPAGMCVPGACSYNREILILIPAGQFVISSFSSRLQLTISCRSLPWNLVFNSLMDLTVSQVSQATIRCVTIFPLYNVYLCFHVD